VKDVADINTLWIAVRIVGWRERAIPRLATSEHPHGAAAAHCTYTSLQ